MLAATRRLHIGQIVERQGQVKVSELAAQFHVSDETIRRDLAVLEQQGILLRDYGGAVLKQGNPEVPLLPPLEERQTVHHPEKAQIGHLAASMVKDGQVVILDAGSTTLEVARALRTLAHLTVITNDLAIADELRSAEGVRVIVTGGYLKPRSRSLIGPEAVAAVRRYNADIAFLGVTGISLEQGMTTTDIFEAEMKSAMLHSARRRVVVADHSKLGRTHLATFASPHSVNALVTDWQAPADLVSGLQELGIQVIQAAKPKENGA